MPTKSSRYDNKSKRNNNNIMKVGEVVAPANVESAIDKINLKIDYLSSNLNNYTSNIENTMKEIPKDIRSIRSMNSTSR